MNRSLRIERLQDVEEDSLKSAQVEEGSQEADVYRHWLWTCTRTSC